MLTRKINENILLATLGFFVDTSHWVQPWICGADINRQKYYLQGSDGHFHKGSRLARFERITAKPIRPIVDEWPVIRSIVRWLFESHRGPCCGTEYIIEEEIRICEICDADYLNPFGRLRVICKNCGRDAESSKNIQLVIL